MDPDGSSVFKYDLRGNLIVNEYHGHDTFNGESDKIIFRYASDTLMGEMYYQPVDTLRYSMVIKYDKMGNRSEWYKDHINKGGNHTKTTNYDLKGNVVKQTSKSREGRIIWSVTHKYTYDSQGNWIKDIYTEFGEKPVLSERMIEYYIRASGRNK